MKMRIAIVMRRVAAVVVALLAGSAAMAATDGIAAVTAVRLRDAAPASTQVVVDLAAHRSARLFTLTAPDRVVLDITAANADEAVVRETVGLGARGAALQRIRLGRQPGNVLRLVLDTRRAVAASFISVDRAQGQGVQLIVTLDASTRTAGDSLPSGAAVRPSVPRRVVAIDAGHGGADLGSLGHAGTREKDVTLTLAKALANRVDALPGWRAVLIRTDDSAMTPGERRGRAAQAGASLFVSLQANAAANPDLAGAAVYVYDTVASSRNAAWLAEREDGDTGPPPTTLPIAMPAADSRASSLAVADAVVKALQPTVLLQHQAVQHAPMPSLRHADIPAVLVDVACLSNREDEQRVGSQEYAAGIAEAIARALDHHVDRRAPSGQASHAAVVAAHQQG
ncbi:MAG: N-acetylmuramoyl-L-alanine amidase [Burkholderiales bacterium]|nr:N-acetylmuramoyl-L-alanine amidase [Burkholderiales bacterium]